MKNVLNTIRKNNLIQKGERVAVACSGGRDSMSLLHFLIANKEKLGIEVLAVNVDHGIRENSKSDSAFVANYCKAQNIELFMFAVDAKKFSTDNKLTLEQGARECRYKAFKTLFKNGKVDKIALAHHKNDQAETILLNILRGAGLTGAGGMEYIRDDIFIRPLLDTNRNEVMAYIAKNEIPYVDDETNDDSSFSRNYIRNNVLPIIRNKWQNADTTICNFGKICRQDNEFIATQILPNNYLVENGEAKIYLNIFKQPTSIVSRVIFKVLKEIGVTTNIEQKHIKLIRLLAVEGINGSKLNLPNSVTVAKEYSYILLTNKDYSPPFKKFPLVRGETEFENFGIIKAVVTRKFNLEEHNHLIDYNKLPKGVCFRYRKEGDVFEKFGGGTKSLNNYFIDRKIPKRIRNFIPLLAYENEVFMIAGVEISDKVRIDANTKSAWGFKVIKF